MGKETTDMIELTIRTAIDSKTLEAIPIEIVAIRYHEKKKELVFDGLINPGREISSLVGIPPMFLSLFSRAMSLEDVLSFIEEKANGAVIICNLPNWQKEKEKVSG